MSSQILISCENVGKKFARDLKTSLWYGLTDSCKSVLGKPCCTSEVRNGEFWANSEISFELRSGDSLALIGGNGAGKTTLLKMLNGLISPNSGRITVRGRVSALIALGAGFNPVLTGRENIFVNGAILGLRRQQISKKLSAIVDFAEIGHAIDAPVRTYSSGMQVRLGFAVATTLLAPDIMLVDEVLAVGDINFRVKCYNRLAELRRNGAAFILVSHSSNAISAFASNAILLNNGRMEYSGDVARALELYAKSSGKAELRVMQGPVNRTSEITLCSATIMVNGGAAVSVRSGDCAVLSLLISAKCEVKNVLAHVLISKNRDLTDAISIRHQVPALPSLESFIEVTLSPVCLAAGDYTIKLSITADGQIVSYVESLPLEVVLSEDRQHPLIHQPVVWTCREK